MDVVEPVQGDEDHGADQVGAVVHRDVRLVLQGGGDVPVVAVLVLALDGVDGDAEVLHQAGGDVVLGRQRVGRDEDEVGAAGLERAGQVGRLGRHVQAGRHPHARQRLLRLEPLADGPRARACRARPSRSAACRRRPARNPSRHPCGTSQSRLPKSVLLLGGDPAHCPVSRKAVSGWWATDLNEERQKTQSLAPLPVHPVQRTGFGMG